MYALNCYCRQKQTTASKPATALGWAGTQRNQSLELRDSETALKCKLEEEHRDVTSTSQTKQHVRTKYTG